MSCTSCAPGRSPYSAEMTSWRVGPGSVSGEFAVLGPAPRSADVVATADTDLLILDRTTLLDLMGRQPEVAADIITMLVRRVRADATSGA
jgi:CRP/FNR family transcriptional regulator, cyclic AMP receptor protein